MVRRRILYGPTSHAMLGLAASVCSEVHLNPWYIGTTAVSTLHKLQHISPALAAKILCLFCLNLRGYRGRTTVISAGTCLLNDVRSVHERGRGQVEQPSPKLCRDTVFDLQFAVFRPPPKNTMSRFHASRAKRVTRQLLDRVLCPTHNRYVGIQ